MDRLVINFCRSAVIAKLWRLEVARLGKKIANFLRFLEKRPLTGKFSKLYSESFHRDTD